MHSSPIEDQFNHNGSMSTSTFPISCRQLLHSLDRACHLLRVANKHLPKHDSPSHKELLAARLAPDMLHLAHQIEVLVEGVTGSLALLAGMEHPANARVFNRGEELLPVLPWATLDEAIAHMHLAYRDAERLVEGALWIAEDAAIVVRRAGDARQFLAAAFAECYAVPNALFHLSMVYALLRSRGIPLGKADFEGLPAYIRIT